MEFRLLGNVEVVVDGRAVEVGHIRQQCVLAALLVDANRTVPVDQLVDRVWAERIPQRSRNTLSAYLSRLRRLLAGTDEARIVRQSGGYQLVVDPLAVDVHRFSDLDRRARSGVDAAAASDLMDQALALWRGEPFASMDTPWINTVRDTLTAQRRALQLDRNDIVLETGRHAELVAELVTAVAAQPLDERLAGQLMLALYRCGRQADALRRYDDIRSQLAEALGIDPGPALQMLHKRILTADRDLIVQVPAPGGGPPKAGASQVVPHHLPAPPRWFAGRDGELATLDALLTSSADDPMAVVISAVSGTAGVGKTALAVRWAHRIADRFPDGQLYVNLRGFDANGSGTDPAEAVAGFLDALGVAPARIPAGLTAQIGLYRSLLSGRRILVVLDNARDAEQVRPLLPGAPGCLVIVTSRMRLSGLVATDGAHPLTLDLLPRAGARELLLRRLGADLLAAHPDAVEQIVTSCAGLPLALAIVAARAAADPVTGLDAIAAELRDARGGLDAFDLSDPSADVRTIFSWSYRALSDDAALVFRRLALHPGPDISATAAAGLTGKPADRLGRMLDELVRAHMLAERGRGRYAFHDLLRAFALEQAHRVDPRASREEALHRLLDHYVHTARAADRLLAPQREPVTFDPPLPSAAPIEPADAHAALAWFVTEHRSLLAAVGEAHRAGLDARAWQLVWTLNTYLDRRGHWADWLQAHQVALSAARQSGDRGYEAFAHRGLGHAYARLHRPDDAVIHLQRALDLYTEVGDRPGQAHMHAGKTRLLVMAGRHRDAIQAMTSALRLFQAIGDRPGYAQAFGNLGWLQVMAGEYDAALVSGQAAIGLLEDLGDRFAQAATWDNLGNAHHHLGHHHRAAECYRRSLDCLHGLGAQFEEAQVHIHLGDTLTAAGDAATARTAWRQAWEILESLGHPDADGLRGRLHDVSA